MSLHHQRGEGPLCNRAPVAIHLVKVNNYGPLFLKKTKKEVCLIQEFYTLQTSQSYFEVSYDLRDEIVYCVGNRESALNLFKSFQEIIPRLILIQQIEHDFDFGLHLNLKSH